MAARTRDSESRGESRWRAVRVCGGGGKAERESVRAELRVFCAPCPSRSSPLARLALARASRCGPRAPPLSSRAGSCCRRRWWRSGAAAARAPSTSTSSRTCCSTARSSGATATTCTLTRSTCTSSRCVAGAPPCFSGGGREGRAGCAALYRRDRGWRWGESIPPRLVKRRARWWCEVVAVRLVGRRRRGGASLLPASSREEDRA